MPQPLDMSVFRFIVQWSDPDAQTTNWRSTGAYLTYGAARRSILDMLDEDGLHPYDYRIVHPDGNVAKDDADAMTDLEHRK